jgi:hypothetical protein
MTAFLQLTRFGLILAVIAIVLMAIAGAVAPLMPPLDVSIQPPENVITSEHASLHPEANVIRECSKDPSKWQQIWINKSLERFNCLIQLPDGTTGNYVLQPCKRGILEITAYIIAGGKLEDWNMVLTAKGCFQLE